MNFPRTWNCRLALKVLLGLGSVIVLALPVGLRAETANAANTSQQSIRSLPAAAQAAISTSLGRDDAAYQVTPTGAGFETRNARHHVTAAFKASGVTFRSDQTTWAMTLSGWGYGSRLKPLKAAVPHAAANRVEYAHGPLTEWYVNGPLGLEQGFTLNRRPAGSAGKGRSELTVALSIAGDLTATSDANLTGLTLSSRDGRARLRYSGLSARDAAGKALRARLEVAGDRLLLKVDDRTARYPVTIDPWVEEAKLTASDAGIGDSFGHSVAISGDTVVIGAPWAKIGSNYDQGAAYIFTISGGTATQVAKLVASDGKSSDFFGWSAAISGNTVVVGAYFANEGSYSNQGAAYVFIEPPGGWSSTPANPQTEAAKLTSAIGSTYEYFGYSVAVDGDTAVVGLESGAAYVFVKPSGGWSAMTETAKLTASDEATTYLLGASTAISGNTVVVGSPYSEIGSNSEQGAAYVYVEPGGGWSGHLTETAKLVSSDGVGNDDFGRAVGISGNTIVVGADCATVNQNTDSCGPGAAYVFVEPTGGWSGTASSPTNETAKLTASDGVADDGLGYSAGISGNTVVVGAPYATIGSDPDETEQGAAYVFVMPSGGWSGTVASPMNETAKVSASDAAENNRLGYSAAVDSNTNTAVAGAPYADVDQGFAYVFAPSNNAQSINFSTVATPVYANSEVTLTAAASSGLEVTFTSQTTSVCTIESGSTSLSGGTTTATADTLTSGTCTIQATQTGNGTYAAATPVSQSFTVNPEPQTITFANPGAQTTGAKIALSATASSGLTVSFASLTASVCTVSGTTASLIAAGACTIQAAQAGNNVYAAASSVTQSFTVNAAVTISWTPATPITYGAALGSGQFNAAAFSGSTNLSADGVFAYYVGSVGGTAAGSTTILPGGTNQLCVQWSPSSAYASQFGSASLCVAIVVNQATPVVALTSSVDPSGLAQSVTFTAKVSSPAGTPSGSVGFYDGSTLLGTEQLTSGVASYSTAALIDGPHSITAQYSGDTNFAQVTSAVYVQAVVSTLTIAMAPGAPSVANGTPGGVVTYLLTVTPPASNAATLSIAGLPPGCGTTLSPSTVAAGAGPTEVELTITIPAQSGAASLPGRPGPLGRLPVALGLLLPLLAFRRSARRASRFLLLTILALVASAGIAGCSHFSSQFSGTFTQSGSYTVTVTATAGTEIQSTTLTLNLM
jgi:hypothetical protein